LPSREARLDAQRARDEAYAGGNPAAAIGRLLSLVQGCPGDEVLQRITARVLGEIGESDRALSAWRGIVARYPQSQAAFLGLVRAVASRSGPAEAPPLIRARLFRDPTDFDNLLSVARAWDAIGNEGEANDAFFRLATLFPDREEGWSAAVARLEAKGWYREAAELLLKTTQTPTPPGRQVARLRDIENIIPHVPAPFLGGAVRPRRRRALAAIGGLLDELVAIRNEVRPPVNPSPRSLIMITGNLGAGGSERQLLNTVDGLRAQSADPRIPSLERVKVVVQSCRTRKHHGFFRPQLSRAGVPVVEYEELPLFGGDFACSAVRSIAHTLRYLPSQILESVLRLSDALRQWRPDMVQIWQEPIVFEAALAALLARVPLIIVCLRSVPAIDRPDRYRLEYPLIFKSLWNVHNVVWTSNSRFVAARYAQWLGIDQSRIRIVPNGVERLSTEGDEISVKLYRIFDKQTAPSHATVGVVMRMDANKRPLLWVEAAASILEKVPSARFILVGDGPLRRTAMKWIEQRGLADRFLFVGLSSNVGFWVSKMDVFMLLSRQEGLPNVLIEAQLGGVPVVITPAGGAPEAVIAGVTGVVTERDPTAGDVAATVLKLIDEPDLLRRMGKAGAEWAKSAFSTTQMLRKTICLMNGTEFE
jgi:glycosyltransferase involved in cell wall biosynthesis